MKVKIRKCTTSNSFESKITLDDAPLKNMIKKSFNIKNIDINDCEEKSIDSAIKVKSEDTPVDLNNLIFVDPVAFLTPTTNKLCLKFINAICTFRYGKINSNKIDECHNRVVDIVHAAYKSGNNVLATIFGYIKITNIENNQYSNKKINLLANVIITLILALGEDFDFDIVETTIDPELFDLCTCQSL